MNKQSDKCSTRVQNWVEQLEAWSHELLDCTDMACLKPGERLELIMRCLDLLRRFIALGHEFDALACTEEEMKAQQIVMGKIRAEEDTEKFEKVGVPFMH
jgi:hypothetical protein